MIVTTKINKKKCKGLESGTKMNVHWDEPNEKIIYLEYVANIFTELKTSVRKKL